MKTKTPPPVFVQGAISPDFVAQSIAKHQSKTNIGAHNIFLGQVRADIIEQKQVAAIEYSAYEAMAEPILHEIREAAFAAFDLTCLHIHHSLGQVKTGEICLFVFASSPRRAAAFEACQYLVERIKKEVPIWGKEIFEGQNFEGQSFVWKVNT